MSKSSIASAWSITSNSAILSGEAGSFNKFTVYNKSLKADSDHGLLQELINIAKPAKFQSIHSSNVISHLITAAHINFNNFIHPASSYHLSCGNIQSAWGAH